MSFHVGLLARHMTFVVTWMTLVNQGQQNKLHTETISNKYFVTLRAVACDVMKYLLEID